jgi:anaerobic magnesium-protoporphyrin IX monomethyl ester cyclase
MRRVLFVNAVDPVSEIQNRYRPLWPAYLVAAIEKSLGQGKIVFKFMTNSFKKEIQNYRPDVVGISAVSQNYNYAKQYAHMAKKQGLKVVVGGIHISCIPESLTEDMDIGCLGEAEDTFAALMQLYLDTGSFPVDQLERIEGIIFWHKGVRRQTPDRKLLTQEQIIRPKRSAIGYQRHDYMFTSRGCPYNCVFCSSSRYWEKVRYTPTTLVLEEIRELIDHGVRMISFYDDLFIANKKRFKELSNAIVARGLHEKVQFSCSCRANALDEETVERLTSMNIVSIGMGLESGSERILKYLKGNCTLKDNYSVINMLKDAGIQVNASFIIGAPDETEAEIMQTYNFVKKSRIDFFDIYLLTPYPGTPVWLEAMKINLVSNDMDWDRLNVNLVPDDPQSIILSQNLDRKKLASLYRKFKRLRLFKIIRALPGSPWIYDLPRVCYGILKEKLKR